MFDVFGVCETFGQHLHLVVRNGTTCEEKREVCSKMKKYNKKFQIAFFLYYIFTCSLQQLIMTIDCLTVLEIGKRNECKRRKMLVHNIFLCFYVSFVNDFAQNKMDEDMVNF